MTTPTAASPRQHWDAVYRNRSTQAVSWYAEHLDSSLQLLVAAGLDASSRLIDVGAGASTLVDDLLRHGVSRITLLDLAADALEVSRQRLGAAASTLDWRVGDITSLELPEAAFTHWHDRAVLHFLTTPEAAAAYARQAARALAPGGQAVIAGFAADGPERCSGLPVARRSAEQIADLLGPGFRLLESRRELHRTPGGSEQAFCYARLQRD